jgi:hypothetical protein
MKHGAPEPIFGVKFGDLKRVKKDHQLALGLYSTGNSDAMYLTHTQKLVARGTLGKKRKSAVC